MLLGPLWVIDYIRLPKPSGNTAEGRAWTLRVKEENPKVTVKCDDCGTSESADASNRRRLREIVKQALRQESLWGRHLCRACAMQRAGKKQSATKATKEWKEAQPDRPSWQSQADPAVRQAWTDRIGKSNREVNRGKTPEERQQGVLKQWETMTEKQKAGRAKKIGRHSRKWWASLSPEDRMAHIKKLIKGLPRSKVSDEFKEALIENGLYTGFQSEQGISGFVVDEANHNQHLVLEFYGDYYHCNPRTYHPEFYNTTTHKTAAEQWQYDRRRFAAIRKAGYRVLVVWEDDWRQDPKKVLGRVRLFLEGSKSIPPA